MHKCLSRRIGKKKKLLPYGLALIIAQHSRQLLLMDSYSSGGSQNVVVKYWKSLHKCLNVISDHNLCEIVWIKSKCGCIVSDDDSHFHS